MKRSDLRQSIQTTLLFPGGVVFFIIHLWFLLSALSVRAEIIVDHYHDAPEELSRFDDSVRKKQWSQALKSIQDLHIDHGGELVEVSPGHYRNLTEICQEKIAQAPRELLELWRQEIDLLTRPRWERALSTRSQRALARLVNTNYCSSYTGKALKVLCEIALNTKDRSSAEYYSARLLNTSLQGEVSPPVLPALADPVSFVRSQSEIKKIWQRPLSGSERFLPSPVRCSDLLCLIQGNRVYGYDLNSGGTPFEGVDSGAPVLYESFPSQGRNRLSKQAAASQLADRIGSQGTFNDGNLYAFLEGPDKELLAICLDLERSEGKLIWKNSGIDSNAQMQSPPLIFNGALYVVVSGDKASNQFNVYCLDLVTGQVRWKSHVGSLVNSNDQKTARPPQFQLAQSGPDLAILLPGQLVARIDSFSGIVREVKGFSSLDHEPDENTQLLLGSQMLQQDGQRLFLKSLFGRTSVWSVDLSSPVDLTFQKQPEEALHSVIVLRTPDTIHWRNLQDGRLLHQISLPAELQTKLPQKGEERLFLMGRFLIQISRKQLTAYRFETGS